MDEGYAAAVNDPTPLLAAALGAEGAARLLPHLEAVDLADGDVILTDGAPSSHLYLLVGGELGIVHVAPDGKRVDLGTRGPGSWIGEVGFVDAGPATATVVAKGPCRVLRIDHATLLRLADERPDVASVVLRVVTRQLAERIATSSSGIVEALAPGQVRVRKPEEVRGWVARALGWLVGDAR